MAPEICSATACPMDAGDCATLLGAGRVRTLRLFLAAPKTTAPDEKWTPQAQLSLADANRLPSLGVVLCSV